MLHAVILITDGQGKKYITLTFGDSVADIENTEVHKTFTVNHKFVYAKSIKVLDSQNDGYTHFDATRFIRKFAKENNAEGIKL